MSKLRSLLIALTVALLPVVAHAEADPATLLKEADHWRLPDAEARVQTRVRLYRGDELKEEKTYTVYLRPGHRSLVLFRSAGEAGQKVLMLGDDFWMFMPRTHRPIRITPMQKLLGEASTGDIATLTWSDDYTGKLVDAAAKADYCPQGCTLLALTATRPGTTYGKVELWLGRDAQPVYAKLYLASGRLAKEASYRLGRLDGREQVTGMTLYDRINRDRRTEIDYLAVAPAKTPDKLFNPAFLVRDSLEGW